MPMMIPVVTSLSKGASYVGTVTGIIRGERVYRDVEFVAARDQLVEPFVRRGIGSVTPDQDRVFVVHPHGAAPELYVTGSIREPYLKTERS